MRLTLSPS